MTVNFDRRGFLKAASAVGGELALPSFVVEAAELVSGGAIPAYASWKDIYRNQWTWDSVTRSTHFMNCWYQAHCSWDVYVKDGLVYREEQAAEYPQANARVPDFNPRGCQKGGCFSERMYDPTRITHPMRRVGPRGSAKWERVSWKEALDDIADTYIDVTLEEGTDRTIWDIGPGIDAGVNMAAMGRFSAYTQSIALDMNGEIGDGRRGCGETFGKIVMERSADDYFNSDLILFWAGNPLYTQIPQAHFYTTARYAGARIISIAPDYNASAIKADLWVPIKPGTDAALALGIAHELVREGKIKQDFLKEQTDFPLLVRSDTRRFLKQADIAADGKEDRYVFWSEASNSPQVASFDRLSADGDPRLDVREKIRLKDGKTIEVRSVYSLLRDRLADYSPEKVAPLCGVAPEMIRTLVSEISRAKAMANVAQSVMSKYTYGNLAERAIILIFCLTGNLGRQGAGYSGFPLLEPDGMDKFTLLPSMLQAEQMLGMLEGIAKQQMAAGATHEMVSYALGTALFHPGSLPFRTPVLSSGTLFWQVHGGLIDLAKDAQKWDPHLKRPTADYLNEALDKNWQPANPPRGRTPRMLFSLVSNPLRRLRGSEKVLETLWPQLKKVVVLDWRITSTARHADYVLPAAPWYERTNLKWVTPLSPFLTTSQAATKPLGDSKGDWDIIVLLAKHIQERAIARGVGKLKSPQGIEVNLTTLYDDMTMQGMFKEGDEAKVAKAIYDLSGSFKKQTWEETQQKGFVRFEKLPEDPVSVGNMCEFPEHDTIAPLTFHVRDKVPYPTATRRIQFYLDHPWYDDADELLPRYKAPPRNGGDFPLMMTGGHTRWSIHSTWRDSPLMLRLHRPEPYLLVSQNDAAKRGIQDNDWIRVFNDVGAFEVRAKVAPSLQDGQTLIYHAWESYQFRGKGDMNSVCPTPLNPVELAGDYGHFKPKLMYGTPSVFDRDTRIEIERLPDRSRKHA